WLVVSRYRHAFCRGKKAYWTQSDPSCWRVKPCGSRCNEGRRKQEFCEHPRFPSSLYDPERITLIQSGLLPSQVDQMRSGAASAPIRLDAVVAHNLEPPLGGFVRIHRNKHALATEGHQWLPRAKSRIDTARAR